MAKNLEAATRMREALNRSGLKAAELARRLKVSQPTVHGWLNGSHGITWPNARRVARELRVTPGWIVFGSDEEAQRVAQTSEELAFLNMFRDADDEGQVSILKYLAALPHRKGPPRP